MANYVHQTWWRKNRGRTLVAAAVVLLVVAGAVAWVWQSSRCAAGIERTASGECVGMSDGSFEFAPELAGVLGKIKAENDRVLAESNGNHVSIAYLAPMTLTGLDTITSESTRNALQGAYVSQLRANRTADWDGATPMVRLLPANPGSRFDQWQPVVAQIEQARSGPDRVVAVTGLGQSHEGTKQAIDRLAALGMPMVGATITADVFTEQEKAGEFSGLLRVAPSNTEQVQAVVRRLTGSRRAMLVQDENQSDLLASNLAKAFEQVYPASTGGELLRAETYNSKLDDATGTGLGSNANAFAPMVRNICVAQPDVLFFSGRYRDLKGLLEALGRRWCPQLEIRVLTLDSVVDIAGVEEIRGALSPNTTLEYTHLSSPAAWRADPQAFDPNVVGYFRETYSREFPDDSAGDGMAATSFDAVGVAVTAIRRAGGTGRDVSLVTPESVTSQFHRMHGVEAVAGASGWLSFDCVGHPEDKAVSVFTLTPGKVPPTSEILPEVVSASGDIRTPDSGFDAFRPTQRCR
ncbi:ABC-type branched-chain amino acid transport system, substrate-binding protein [Saccharopolyspora kobensis]|uniref:ABC-type branched-chain amino acid transport system, substrate-binding protein n=1 Tax=Saccharopolyspora kobensis TaxID=146035 RepID=A0A1H5UIN2_9PSEU|nr:ABC transporter substrate-binding protein [Saccharopolyspora kobensis]SEF74886.1 ABC-type branched-chain amino acid transport system, substrate-binding protein [Saccharopolyspora kobensis]SFC72930.1 ABC-type branched-chain amino acid transport system, substrate-binding protein [Saccharopolyspora kobensis]